MKSIKSILRKNSTSRTPSNIPDLPEAINDNFYLASASKAAEMDIASGAYDEFLFSEDGMAKMPYEQAVEDHLALVGADDCHRGAAAHAGSRASFGRHALPRPGSEVEAPKVI